MKKLFALLIVAGFLVGTIGCTGSTTPAGGGTGRPPKSDSSKPIPATHMTHDSRKATEPMKETKPSKATEPTKETKKTESSKKDEKDSKKDTKKGSN